MDEKYIDDFFENGNIRLSCFNVFHNYEDEIRGDSKEGSNSYYGLDKENENTIMIRMSSGHNTYVLSSSLILNENLMNEDNFKTDGVFKIKNTYEFGASIANRLANFKRGLEGGCQYVNQRIVKREIGELNLDDMKVDDGSGSIDMQKLMNKSEAFNDISRFFLKEFSYSYQVEYRHLWFMNHKVKDHIIVTCPEAVKHCERIQKDEIPNY